MAGRRSPRAGPRWQEDGRPHGLEPPVVERDHGLERLDRTQIAWPSSRGSIVGQAVLRGEVGAEAIEVRRPGVSLEGPDQE